MILVAKEHQGHLSPRGLALGGGGNGGEGHCAAAIDLARELRLDHVCTYVCMDVCMYVRMSVWMDVCMYVCMYACMHVFMYSCRYEFT